MSEFINLTSKTLPEQESWVEVKTSDGSQYKVYVTPQFEFVLKEDSHLTISDVVSWRLFPES